MHHYGAQCNVHQVHPHHCRNISQHPFSHGHLEVAREGWPKRRERKRGGKGKEDRREKQRRARKEDRKEKEEREIEIVVCLERTRGRKRVDGGGERGRRERERTSHYYRCAGAQSSTVVDLAEHFNDSSLPRAFNASAIARLG